MRHLGLLTQRDGEHIGDRALLDHETAVHVGFTELQFGIEENAPLGGARRKRTDTGWPVPSPKVKVVPREVVTRKVPRRINVFRRN